MPSIAKSIVATSPPLLSWGRTTFVAVLIALSMALVAAPVQAAIRYVDVVNGVNGGNCDAPMTACNRLTDALAVANDGDEIRVATGVYTEPEITVARHVTITGGYNPNGPTLWNSTTYTLTPTILDGQATNRVLNVVVGDVALQFMTIRNGDATNAATPHQGGGILVSGAQDVLLLGLTIQGNVASTTDPASVGGGVAIRGNSRVNIQRTMLISNTAALGGGLGMNIAAGNFASMEIRSSVIAHNSATEGGVLGTTGDGRVQITFYTTTMADNNQGTPGADEAVMMKAGDATTASGINFSYNLLMGNNTILRSTLNKTPAIMSTGILRHPDVVNTWEGNVPVLNDPPIRTLTFVNAAALDYHLVAGSPAIDLAGAGQKVDLEGRKRVNSATCTPLTLCPLGRADDYGAYEYVYTAPVVRYIATEGSSTSNNCQDPNLPCRIIEDATRFALGGDEIRLAVGTYSGGDAVCGDFAVLCIREAITVSGGYTLTNWTVPTNDPNRTVLDAGGTRRGIMADYNAPFASALVRNLKVINGYSLEHGGGIAVNTQMIGPAHNLTFRNCRVENNRADSGDGGGIFANEPSNLRVEDCVIAGNYLGDGRGGGIAMVDATGAATYTLRGLVVYNNMAARPDENSANGGMGGGVFLQGVGTLRQSEIYSNSAAFSGGGVTTGSNNADPTIDRVIIRDNQASLGGGFSIFLTAGATLQNSLLARNVATSTVGLVTGQTATPMLGGNAIHSPYIGVPTEPLHIINVTIADNIGAVDDAVRLEGLANQDNSRRNFFTNVLISGSSVGIRSNGEGFATLTKVLITNDVTTPTDGFAGARLSGTPLSGTPGYVGNGDYHLLPGADGVDDGDTVAGITQDLDGVSRPVGPAFDIGAYETTLQKQNQTISFPNPGNKALADSPVQVNPTASSGLPVQVTSQTPAVCTVSGNSVTLLTVGTCTLQANQPGNATFNAALPVTQSFAIGQDAPPQVHLLLPMLEKQ